MLEKRLLNIEEASNYLGICKKGLYNMVYQRKIPYVKIGGRLRFDIKDLDKWIDENKVKDVNTLLKEKIKLK